METAALLKMSLFLQTGLALAVLVVILFRGANKVYPQLPLLLGAQCVSVVVSLATLYFREDLGISLNASYWALYVSSWVCGGLAFLLRILLVYAVFAEAMRPMSGLHQAGKMVFRWVGVVSGLVALALVAGPGVFSSISGLTTVFSRLQQGVSVLTLCLLVFVCFASRPLGLTFRSHLFGVSLGLGVASLVELVESAWMVTYGARSLYSPIYLFTSLGFCASLAIWGVYFGMPEPARRMILLPTTSPFFFWNRISEILGDSPGHVAVAGFSPDMLAPAEIEMLTAATASESESESMLSTPRFDPTESRSLPEFTGAPRPSLA